MHFFSRTQIFVGYKFQMTFNTASIIAYIDIKMYVYTTMSILRTIAEVELVDIHIQPTGTSISIEL